MHKPTRLLRSARHVYSPNQNARPAGTLIDLLVIHCISLPPDEFIPENVDALFTNKLDPKAHPYFAKVAGLQVSAHVMIDRDGLLTQYVDFEQRAWHAGDSSYQGRKACNDFSIGVELLGSEKHSFTDAQYETLCILTKTLQQIYPDITKERITGHNVIAPGRKSDPGPLFDWDRYFHSLNRDLSPLEFKCD